MLIGVFDSGIGGLTVLRAIKARWPGHSTLYLGDTARVPYGTKSRQTVINYARQTTAVLLERGVDLIVVACNTASAYALDALTGLAVPVLGVIEPGAEAAVAATRGGLIGVIGTPATIASGAYEAALRRRLPGVRLATRACPLFVPLAEEGWEDTPIARAVAERYLADWLPGRAAAERPDVLVLGCTHYPVLRAMLTEVLGPEVALIDSAEAAAEALTPLLEGAGAGTGGTGPATHRLLVTDGAEGFGAVARRLLGSERLELEVIDLCPGA